MRSFDANRDITIAATGFGGEYCLRSQGLARRGLPELEMIGVPTEHLTNAGMVINQIANYTANHARVGPGERISISSSDGALVARLQQGPKLRSESVMGRLLKRTTEYLRISEPVDGMRPQRTMLSTIMLWRAHALLEVDDVPGARGELLSSIAYFPGDPARPDEVELGVPLNWENHLSYALLARISERDEAVEYLHCALERCRGFASNQLGDEAKDLVDLDRAGLLDRVEAIVQANLDTARTERVNDGLVIVSSPIWTRAATGECGDALRKAALLPAPFTAYYYDQPIADRLRMDPGVAEVAVDLLLKHAARPAGLLWLTTGIRELYDGEDPAQSLMFEGGDLPPYRPGDMVLSLALAHVARLASAGLTVHELRAWCELADDASVHASAGRKLRELDQREGAAYVAALAS